MFKDNLEGVIKLLKAKLANERKLKLKNKREYLSTRVIIISSLLMDLVKTDIWKFLDKENIIDFPLTRVEYQSKGLFNERTSYLYYSKIV